ncbi:MAG: hypothetical protein A2Y12_09360 [Planctomycetes bacterium GWF2_42_9]|nr:MAG: hypothetical protein A2Y12_09360 [Planctomycetes bacterium GWF2_42_9]
MMKEFKNPYKNRLVATWTESRHTILLSRAIPGAGKVKKHTYWLANAVIITPALSLGPSAEGPYSEEFTSTDRSEPSTGGN